MIAPKGPGHLVRRSSIPRGEESAALTGRVPGRDRQRPGIRALAYAKG